MAQSPEGPQGPPVAAPPPQQGDLAGFIIGIVIGLPVGGTVMTLLFFLIIALIGSYAFPHVSYGGAWTLAAMIPALALGVWGILYSRKAMSFISGAMIGLGAGLLGGTALCAAITGSFGQ